MDLVDYQKLNDSFKPTLVFHLGVEAGFFSEFNNMVLAMLYCLHHAIRFVLYSDNANFKVGKGWDNHFFVLAKAGNRGLQGAEQAVWIRRLEAEHGNMRAAIAFALAEEGDPVIAVKMEVALMRFRILRGYVPEGRTNVRAVLALPAIQGSDIGMPMRSMSALRSPAARARIGKRRGCWSPASHCGAASATRSTSRQRCPPWRWCAFTSAMP